MRKFIWLFVGLVLIVSSCKESGSSNENSVVVKGQFENAAQKVLLLKNVKNNQLATLDSTTTDENGNFELVGEIAFEDYLIIQSEDQQQFVQLIAIPGEVIKINADFADMAKTYTTEGSIGTSLMKEITDFHLISVARVDSLGQIFRKYSSEGNAEDIKDQIDEAFRDIVEEEKVYLTEIINQNDSSLAALFALYQQMGPQSPIFFPDQDIALFDKVNTKLSKKLPESELVKSLSDLVDKVKNPPAQVGALGTQVPEIELADPDGKMIKLSDFKGQYVLLDFWAGWCRPCRAENPNIVENYKKYKSDGFEVFQVSLDQTKEAWVQAIKADGLNWIHVSDLKYWQSEAARLYNISSIPASFLLDKEGKVIATNLRGAALGSKLQELFGH
ncbi:MAG: AhpC/TSA family protein [Bacteroidales bacterium]|nr:AhpC/TSA family protein [Bacteroidales bacterium]